MNEIYAGEVDHTAAGASFRDLRRELFLPANHSRQFKSGEQDLVTLSIGMGDRTTPMLVGRVAQNSESYRFEAVRYRAHFARPHVEFEFGYTARLGNMRMPVHIAEQAYGLEGDEAVEEAGPSMVEHSLTFVYNSLIGKLAACESFEYFDSDDDPVLRTCSCPDDHMPDDLSESVQFFGVLDDEDEDDEEEDHAPWAQDSQYLQFEHDAARRMEAAEYDLMSLDNNEVLELSRVFQLQQPLAELGRVSHFNLALQTVRSITKALDDLVG